MKHSDVSFPSSAEIESHVIDKHFIPNDQEEIYEVRPVTTLKCVFCCAAVNSSTLSLINHCKIKHRNLKPKTIKKSLAIPEKVTAKAIPNLMELYPKTLLTCEICQQCVGTLPMGKHLVFFHANKSLSVHNQVAEASLIFKEPKTPLQNSSKKTLPKPSF
jgi:hypothetical protein